jgi:phosphoglycerol transferase MdoB-like AlkP superfamily enzyme
VTEGAKEQDLGTGGISSRAAAWLAWSVCVVILLISAVSLGLIYVGWATQLPDDWGSWQEQIITVVGFIGVPIVGGLIASHRPANSYRWLWLSLGMSFALMQFGQAYATYALVTEPGSLPAPRTVVTVLGQGWVAAIVIVPFLFLLFPDGHLPSPRWRVVAW